MTDDRSTASGGGSTILSPSWRMAFVCALLTAACFVGACIAAGGQPLYAVLSVVFDGGAALCVLLPPAAAGLWLVAALRLDHLPLRWQLLAGAALGIGATSILVLLLGLAGVLHRPLWIALMVCMALSGVVGLARLIRRHGGRTETSNEGGVAGTVERSRPARLWLLVCPFFALALLASTNAPGLVWSEEGFGYDVLEYHLALPKEYRAVGRIDYLPHNVYANFPANVEMLYLLAMILFDGDVDLGTTANMIHLLLGLAVVAGAWTVGRDWSVRAGVLSAVSVAATGWFAYLGGLAYVENGMLFFGIVAIGLLLHAARREDWRDETIETPDDDAVRRKPARFVGAVSRILLPAGVLAGLACGCKYTAVAMIAAPLTLGAAFLPRMNAGRRLAAAGVFAAGVFIAFAPWLVKNLAMTGNPVFPLANSVFDAHPEGWGAAETERWDRGHRPADTQASVTKRVAALWSKVVADDDQRLGVLLLALPLVGLIGRRRDRVDAILLLVLLVQVGVWLFATHLFARFAVVFLIPLALLLGRAGEGRTSGGRRLLIVAVVVGAAWNLAFAVRLNIDESPGGAPAELFYEGRVPGYEYLGVVNSELPADAKVLLVGESRAFYFRRSVDYCVVFNHNPFADAIRSAATDGEVVNWLRDRGYTHVLVNWAEVRRLSRTYGFAEEITPDRFDRLRSHGLVTLMTFPWPNAAEGSLLPQPYVTLHEITQK